MINKMFAVRDAQVEAFLQPFFSPTKGAAIRAMTEAVNDPKHEISRHAKDYSLWHLADFDDSSGLVQSDGPPLLVIACVELINKA